MEHRFASLARRCIVLLQHPTRCLSSINLLISLLISAEMLDLTAETRFICCLLAALLDEGVPTQNRTLKRDYEWQTAISPCTCEFFVAEVCARRQFRLYQNSIEITKPHKAAIVLSHLWPLSIVGRIQGKGLDGKLELPLWSLARMISNSRLLSEKARTI